MAKNKIIDTVTDQDWLDDVGDVVQPIVVNAYKAGGETGKKVKNFMHGTWLGHPLHPILTDVPIGAYTAAAVLDGLELAGTKRYAPGADGAVAVGLVGAAGAAATGLTDWSGTTKKKRKVGMMHGLLNAGATLLYTGSLVLRKKESTRGAAIALSMLGYGVTIAASYLGGHLIYREQVGVDHTATADSPPDKFVNVLPEDDLKENQMKCVTAGEVPVLLAKKNNRIYAIAHTCSHLGGPLSEGELLDDGSVKCPWHDSVFSIKDGRVLEGPATEPQPQFDVRVRKGQIQVRPA